MNILLFLASNWDSAIIIALFAIVIVYLAVKKRWDLLDKILFGLVTWAEREYGGGTGALKLAAVIEKIYPHIPAIVRAFVSTAKIEQMIDKALETAKLRWEKNPKLIENTAAKS
jgi:hypothetical protein